MRTMNTPIDFDSLKIAIVHDWLVDYSGSERVVEQMLNLFPHADLFATVEFLPDHLRGFIKNKKVKTTFIQKLPGARKHYRSYLPLMPIAIEQFDMSGYDLVISSNHAVGKGIITGPDQLHISYVNSPIRYAWDLTHQYLRESGLDHGLKSLLARFFLHKIRLWDVRTAFGVDEFIGNSQFIARRIRKVYRREAAVIYPPVDVNGFTLCDTKNDYFVTVSRMVPYKRVDLIVEAFAKMPDKKLIVIGDGPEFAGVKAKAGDNITLLGFQNTTVVREYVKNARAFVFAAEEDFGIVPVEAQACGTPVIAFGKGGALETVVEGRTGTFFGEQTVASVIDAVARFEILEPSLSYQAIRDNALQFSRERFRRQFRYFVEEAVQRHLSGGQPTIGKLHLKRPAEDAESVHVEITKNRTAQFMGVE